MLLHRPTLMEQDDISFIAKGIWKKHYSLCLGGQIQRVPVLMSDFSPVDLIRNPYHWLHFTGGETEAQSRKATCSSHSETHDCQKWSSGLLKPNELSLTAEDSDLHIYSNFMFSLNFFCLFIWSEEIFISREWSSLASHIAIVMADDAREHSIISGGSFYLLVCLILGTFAGFAITVICNGCFWNGNVEKGEVSKSLRHSLGEISPSIVSYLSAMLTAKVLFSFLGRWPYLVGLSAWWGDGTLPALPSGMQDGAVALCSHWHPAWQPGHNWVISQNLCPCDQQHQDLLWRDPGNRRIILHRHHQAWVFLQAMNLPWWPHSAQQWTQSQKEQNDVENGLAFPRIALQQAACQLCEEEFPHQVRLLLGSYYWGAIFLVGDWFEKGNYFELSWFSSTNFKYSRFQRSL